MCGFAGILNFDGASVEPRRLERMAASLYHRGPDDSGIHQEGPVGLCFRRLSILDLTPAAHQPMLSGDGNFVMVFNGEIYNYLELREELERLGCRFRSHGDSEVLLQAYATWGKNCLAKLNGMWAVLIYDRQRGVLFGSRDRFGVKPLYRYRHAGGVCLASEIKAIRASGLYRGGINWKIASKFLLQGALDEGGETFFDGIEAIRPGSAFEVTPDGRWTEWSYWSMAPAQTADAGNPVERFRGLFEDAVALRMRSDVPVGVCLSGGLDSTSIICSMARIKGGMASEFGTPLLAFCYMPEEYDETRYIADTLEQTHAILKVLQMTPSGLWDRLGKFLWFQDEPVHSMTAMIGYELMGLARANGVKVVLNGQGADETAAGYFNYFQEYWRTLAMEGRIQHLWSEVGAYTALHGGHWAAHIATALKQACQWEMFRLRPYHRYITGKRQAANQANPWFRRELVSNLPADDFAGMDGRIETSLKRSVERSPLPIYLRVEDRNSMAHSVEARLPFMDYRLVSLLFSLPTEWKLRGGLNKFVLREAMRGRIPESVRSRADKMGFPTPVNKWLARDLYKPLKDILSSQEARERGIYQVDEVLKDLDRHQQGALDVSGRLFNVAQFETWAENMKQNPVPAA
ncbi:asparagine synthase (glutamine-hydrolyzing) [Nitrospira moscoviensis]|uniref:asparagine synthase (glutamine-hydrolyzing) n=1 Tax=Nitrospira moscoviensis TaxID=42253 RepID=A0A0K2GGP6_NITMO|nr:asparagine synthase (glutamine-hydrolyzing) [Nitrospira moscoviensis]ALA59792.1 Asparagine synthetase [Nitrospira moscoviensis]